MEANPASDDQPDITRLDAKEMSLESDGQLNVVPFYSVIPEKTDHQNHSSETALDSLRETSNTEHSSETALDSLREQLSKQVALLAAEKRRRHWIEEQRDGLERRLQRCEQLVVQLRSEINCLREGQNISDPSGAASFVSELNATVETILARRPSLATFSGDFGGHEDKDNEDPELQAFLSAIGQQMQTFKKQATRRLEEQVAELEEVRKRLSERLRSCSEPEHSSEYYGASSLDSDLYQTRTSRVRFDQSARGMQQIRESESSTKPYNDLPSDGESSPSNVDEVWQDPFVGARVSSEGQLVESADELQTGLMGPLLWECEPLARNIRLSGDRRLATFIGNKDLEDMDLYGYVATNQAAYRQGGYFFEIIVKKVLDDHDDGLAIGFTATPPRNWPTTLPETIDAIEKSWLVGYVGEMIEGISGEWTKCSWNPSSLKENDCVGAEMSSKGRFAVYVNGKQVFKSHIPLKHMPQLYGVVDLLGNTGEVQLVEGIMFGTARDSVCLEGNAGAFEV